MRICAQCKILRIYRIRIGINKPSAACRIRYAIPNFSPRLNHFTRARRIVRRTQANRHFIGALRSGAARRLCAVPNWNWRFHFHPIKRGRGSHSREGNCAGLMMMHPGREITTESTFRDPAEAIFPIVFGRSCVCVPIAVWCIIARVICTGCGFVLIILNPSREWGSKSASEWGCGLVAS